MSRRITFFALAASADADRNASVRRSANASKTPAGMSEVAEPATSSLPPPVADASAAAEASAAAVAPAAGEASAAVDANAAAPKLTPARALPQVVETPQVAPVKAIAAPAPRPPVQNFADHEPAKLAPRVLKPAPAPLPVRVTHAVPAGRRARRAGAAGACHRHRYRARHAAPRPRSSRTRRHLRRGRCGAGLSESAARSGLEGLPARSTRAISAVAAPTAIIRSAPTAIGPTASTPRSAARRFI